MSATPAAPVGTTTPASEKPSAPVAEAPVSDLIDLPSGKELNEASANTIAASRPVRVIVLAGPVDSGKTTLLTSLYELFQWGAVADQLFAGSTTLPAFEQRCHLARTASGADTADTGRTPYKGPDPSYLHLRTRSKASTFHYTDFLFTDVSGEMFDHARNTADECKELNFVRRATDLVLLLDGEKALLSDRWSMVKRTQTLLQSFLDCRMLPAFCVVHIVWAKYDYFEAAPNERSGALREFRDEVEGEFRTLFEGRVPHLEFTKIAARPKQLPSLGFGKGVREIFQRWIEFCPRSRVMELNPPGQAGTRESEMFGARYFQHLKGT